MTDEQPTTAPQEQPAQAEYEFTYRGEAKLPDKFVKDGKVDVDSIIRWGSEAEKRMSSRSGAEEDISIERDAPTEVVREIKDALHSAGVPFDEIVASVNRNGKPTEAQYKALGKEGYSRKAVDRIVRAEVAIRSTIASTVFDTVGGEDKYREIQEWAKSDDSGLSDEALERFNNAVNGVDATPESAKEQVEFLMFKYQQSGGTAESKSLISGGSAPGGKGGFGSYEEKRQASVDVGNGKMSVDEYTRRLALTSPEHHKPPRRP